MAGATYGTYSEKEVADRFLRQIGAPLTPNMERAVIAWMRSESGKGSVTANNPWNLTGTIWRNIVGYWRGGSATEQHDFPVFATIWDGVDAAAQNLLGKSYGYPKVIAEARSGDAVGFLNALAASQWCTCHYQYGSGPNLISIYNNVVPGQVTSHAAANTKAGTGSGGTGPTAVLTSAESDVGKWLKGQVNGALTWNDWYRQANNATWQSSPSGLTPEDIRDAISRLGLGDRKMSLTDAARIAGDALGHGATTNPIPGVDAAEAVGAFLGKVADPGNWAGYLAIAGGAALIVWGGMIVWNASGG